MSRKQDRLLAIGKTSDFIGVIERAKIADPIFKKIDVYEFKKRNALKVSKDLCADLAENVFGELKKSSFQIKAQEIKSLKSRGGICLTSVSDPSPQRSIKEKHFFVVILNLRVFGLTFRHSQEPSADVLQNELKFIESLR